jgi:hypothetical protein
VDWLRRFGRATTPAAEASDETVPAPLERSMPGVAALLSGVSDERSHAVLDLGPAANSSLRVYGRFARWVRFADMVGTLTPRDSWAAALDAVPPHPEQPYDIVFAWDILDRIPPEDRPRLVARLTAVTAADARLHALVDASGNPTSHPLRFIVIDTDRVSHQATGPARPARPPLLPAEVERLLAPFHVVQAFTLRSGLREYVAVRQ